MTADKDKPFVIDLATDICDHAWIPFGRFVKHVWHVEMGNPSDTYPSDDCYELLRVRFRAGERAPLPWTKEEFIRMLGEESSE